MKPISTSTGLASFGAVMIARSRAIVISLTALAVVLAVGAAAVVEASDGAAPPVAAQEPAVILAAEDDGDAAEDEAVEQILETVLRTVEVQLTRDPFDPVRPEPPEQPETTDPSAPTTPPGTDPASPPGTGPTPPPGTGPTPPPGTGPTPPPTGNGTSAGRCVDQGELVCDGQVVTVDSTTATTATVTIGTTTYDDVAVGETFATNVTLTGIDDSGCAILRFGEQLVLGCPGRAGTLK